MADYPGMGVMIGMLSGNAETVEALHSAINKTITKAALKDDVLRLDFSDGTAIKVFDDGQSCCESRYMKTDDDLSQYEGSALLAMEIAEAPTITDDYETHEVQFLRVKTTKGTMTLETHNEHNGYYGGFWVVIKKA